MFDYALKFVNVLFKAEHELHALNHGETVSLPDVVSRLFGGRFRMKITVTREE